MPLLLGAAVVIPILTLACWLGMHGRANSTAAGPVPATQILASATVTPFVAAETAPPAISIPPVAAGLTGDDEDSDPLPSSDARPALAPLTPPPAPVTAEQDQKPEKIGQPAFAKIEPPQRPTRRRSEDDLRKELAQLPEFGLSQSARESLTDSYSKQYRNTKAISSDVSFDHYTLLQLFPKAGQLPIRPAPVCQLAPKEAATLGVLAPKLHAYLDRIAPKDEYGNRRRPTLVREVLRKERRGKRPEWLRAEAVPAMVQILMAEDVSLRLILVDLLSEIEAKPATVALAKRAAFDLSPEVRQAAIYALRERPRGDSRPILVNALRYPWSPVADHAADALVALEDEGAIPLLVVQLGKPDPSAPYATGKNGGAAVHEVVRINHQANCLLCHVPAVGGRTDPVVGIDPNVTVTGGGGKYEGPRRTWSLFIRADVQFFRQDFSVSFPIGFPGVRVDALRFDFLVRTRWLKGAELKEWKKQPPDTSTYPQRDATLFALRALTGKDVGPTTEAWARLYPHANAEAEGARLSAAMIKVAPDQRDQLLVKYRDSKEDRYTEGLANAIRRLPSKLQPKAREALVERLLRLPVDSLRTRLEDEDDELRLAASLACVRKADKELVPDLIGLLLDSDREVADGAQKTLERLTGQNFGPPADAGHEERIAAAAEWKAWWRRQAAEED